jgi:hypothetical protein
MRKRRLVDREGRSTTRDSTGSKCEVQPSESLTMGLASTVSRVSAGGNNIILVYACVSGGVMGGRA